MLGKLAIKHCLPSEGPLGLHEIDSINHSAEGLAKGLAAQIERVEIKDSVLDAHVHSLLRPGPVRA